MDKKLYDSNGKELSQEEVLKRLGSIIKIPTLTRVEIITEESIVRNYIHWKPTNDIAISFQDNLRTLKVFITDKIN